MKIFTDIRWAFVYFLIAALLGNALRWAMVETPFFEYRNVTHTHSHIALLGWVYTILTALLSGFFLSEEHKKTHRKIFIFTQITILGMLFSFPFQGYGKFSILFSSLFWIATYFYSYFLLKNTSEEKKKTLGFRFVKSSVFFLILSTCATWALSPIIIKFGKESNWYNVGIYTFLHFQYNGWILTALTGLCVSQIEKKLLISTQQKAQNLLKKSFYLFVLGVFLSVFISFIGMFEQVLWLRIVGGFSAFLWFISLLIITYVCYKNTSEKKWGLLIFLGLFSIKNVIWLGISLPFVPGHLFYNISLVISYLHFTFLGVIVSGIFYLLSEISKVQFPKWTFIFYLIAFFSTEILITYKGFSELFNLWLPQNYFLYLSICSGFFLISVGAWLVYIFRRIDK